MADVTLSYKGSDILELSDSGSATLKTGGKYCEADIGVEYVKPSGGGGDHTVINAITIPNGVTIDSTSYPNTCGVVFNTSNTLSKVEVEYKILYGSTSHAIWLTNASVSDNRPFAPFIDNASASSGGTVITNETVDGYNHITIQLSGWTGKRFKIGSWNDATYSKTCAYKYIKTWDSNGNIMNNFIPVLKNGLPMFYDDITGLYYDNWLGYRFIQGEAVIA